MLKLSFSCFAVFLLAGGFLSSDAFAKKCKPIQLPDTLWADTVIYDIAERMPTFRGGDMKTFVTWAQQKIRYPAHLISDGIQGRVMVQFVIEPTGELSNIEILDSPHPALSDEVIRIIKLSPRWEPGIKDNQPIRVKVQAPFRFTLEDSKPKAREKYNRVPGSPTNRSTQRR